MESKGGESVPEIIQFLFALCLLKGGDVMTRPFDEAC